MKIRSCIKFLDVKKAYDIVYDFQHVYTIEVWFCNCSENDPWNSSSSVYTIAGHTNARMHFASGCVDPHRLFLGMFVERCLLVFFQSECLGTAQAVLKAFKLARWTTSTAEMTHSAK